MHCALVNPQCFVCSCRRHTGGVAELPLEHVCTCATVSKSHVYLCVEGERLCDVYPPNS